MPDYGHSKGYALLPNFCPETDPIIDEYETAKTRQEKAQRLAKERAKREKESKVEFIMLNKAIQNNKLQVKNREKYDIQLLSKNQEFHYKLFDENRFNEIVRKAKQHITLGTSEEESGGPKGGEGGAQKSKGKGNAKNGKIILLAHQSQLRSLPLHHVKVSQQLKTIQDVLLKMVIQSQRCLGI